MFIVLITPPICTILGTKIQATLFNKHIETWKDSLKPNKSYYIAKGGLDHVNANYYSVHKELELTFTDNTIIKESDIEVSTHRFSVGFVSLDHVDKLPNSHILENDGAFLEKMKDDKPILGLFVVSNLKQALVTLRTSEISTISMNSVLFNAQFQNSIDLDENKDFMVTPSKEMRRTIEVPLVYIMDGLLADSQGCLYKFKAIIVDILNKDEPWCSSCKKLSKKNTTYNLKCVVENSVLELYYLKWLNIY
ncbi:hypothetical protein H5410_052035 [Solanum commersonii]|uniref:Uncharacterized protein n=1 Tax=Solanum commersonii TaxID=4109 RepID=A0A9J5X2V1_SOLCO|nr:hypothetical protein H5410_052035 [Solanum commersonii]